MFSAYLGTIHPMKTSMRQPRMTTDGNRFDMAATATALLGRPAREEGRRLLWHCPFHDDRNPSFQVDPSRGTWKCWPCDLGGDAVNLVMKLNAVGFREALAVLARMFGVEDRPTIRHRTPLAATKPVKAPERPPERPSGLPLPDRPGPCRRGRRPPLEARGDRGPGLPPWPWSDRRDDPDRQAGVHPFRDGPDPRRGPVLSSPRDRHSLVRRGPTGEGQDPSARGEQTEVRRSVPPPSKAIPWTWRD